MLYPCLRRGRLCETYPRENGEQVSRTLDSRLRGNDKEGEKHFLGV